MIIDTLQSSFRVRHTGNALHNINSIARSEMQQSGSILVRREALGPALGPLPRGKQYGRLCLQRNNQVATGRRDFGMGCNARRK